MPTAVRLDAIKDSIFSEVTRLSDLHGAINLSQGFPDFPMPAAMKDAACAAIRGDINQYSQTWGAPSLRLAIAEKYRRLHQIEVDPETDVTVTCGATEALIAVFLALFDPGAKVIIIEPHYENYLTNSILSGATPIFVPMRAPDWKIDEDKLRAAFAAGARAIVINTPHNPTGRVLTREEMSLIADLCIKHDAWAITDEIYEHIRFAGNHHAMASWPGMRERTVTISGLSKTYNCTGWRLGYAVAPARESVAIRKIHDFLTIAAASPLQTAAAVGMAFGADYYNSMALQYRERREVLVTSLRDAGFKLSVPEGAYYILADFSDLSSDDDVTFAKWMIEEIGVAVVPGSSFYANPADGRRYVRFAFCKKLETLHAAGERLASLRSRV